jgi:DNA repair exonuclease SbcCD ATPase subunit
VSDASRACAGRRPARLARVFAAELSSRRAAPRRAAELKTWQNKAHALEQSLLRAEEARAAAEQTLAQGKDRKRADELQTRVDALQKQLALAEDERKQQLDALKAHLHLLNAENQQLKARLQHHGHAHPEPAGGADVAGSASGGSADAADAKAREGAGAQRQDGAAAVAAAAAASEEQDEASVIHKLVDAEAANATLREELAALKDEVARLRKGHGAPPPAAAPPPPHQQPQQAGKAMPPPPPTPPPEHAQKLNPAQLLASLYKREEELTQLRGDAERLVAKLGEKEQDLLQLRDQLNDAQSQIKQLLPLREQLRSKDEHLRKALAAAADAQKVAILQEQVRKLSESLAAAGARIHQETAANAAARRDLDAAARLLEARGQELLRAQEETRLAKYAITNLTESLDSLKEQQSKVAVQWAAERAALEARVRETEARGAEERAQLRRELEAQVEREQARAVAINDQLSAAQRALAEKTALLAEREKSVAEAAERVAASEERLRAAERECRGRARARVCVRAV